jgi:hypothetical protein
MKERRKSIAAGDPRRLGARRRSRRMPRALVPATAVALLAAAVAVGQGHAPEEAPQGIVDPAPLLATAPGTTIGSHGLRVTIALPDAQRGFYRSTRFDWSGMITSVTLGGAHFYGLWFDGVAPNIHDFVDTDRGVVVGPRNAATGPAEEFANRDGETVPGYNAAPAGGTFIKIGVGRLRKPDMAPYDHFSPYAIVDGGTWSVRRSADAVVFVQRLAPDADGFGYEYEKTVRVAPGGVMTIGHRLRNIGSKPIRTQVYNHNLARFDGAGIGSGVSIRFPSAVTGPVSSPSLARIDGNALRYLKPLAPGDRVQLPPQPGDPANAASAFTVTGANGATITMQADTPLVRTAVWSIRHAVAVEPFVAIDVAPGAEQRWSWRYTFTAPRPSR